MTRRRAIALPPDQRRESIVDAVIPLLAERGGGVTTAEIAEAAGVAEGTIFTVFDDKASVLHAAFMAVLDPVSAIASINGIDSTLPLPDQLRAAARVLAERGAEVVAVAEAMPGSAKHHHDGIVEAAKDARRKIQAALTAMVARHADDLRLPPSVVASTLQALVWHSGHSMAVNPPDSDQIVDLVLHGALRKDATCC